MAIRPPTLGGEFNLTGGPTSKAGMMADQGGFTEAFAAARKKSSGLNNLPGLGLELGAKKFAADEYAKTMKEKSFWDSEVIDADFNSKASAVRQQGEQSKWGGMLKGGLSIAMAALPLFSDSRVKHTVVELENAMSLLRQLRPVTFYYNEGFGDPDRMHYGFIAQEYAEHMPDATYTDEETGMLCINTVELDWTAR